MYAILGAELCENQHCAYKDPCKSATHQRRRFSGLDFRCLGRTISLKIPNALVLSLCIRLFWIGSPATELSNFRLPFSVQ